MNKKNYQPKPIPQALAAEYSTGTISLCKIARTLKRDETSVRNELKAMGVPIRSRGSKCNATNTAAE